MSGFLLHLLRHGVPVRAGLLLGHVDEPPLVAAIPALLDRVRDIATDRIVTSDLARARRPAELLAAMRDLPCRVDQRWREIAFGEWDGKSSDDVPQDALRAFWADPDGCPPPGGERWRDLCERVQGAVSELSGDTLIFTHAGAMRAALSALTGLDHRAVWALDLPYGALLSLRVWPGEAIDGQVVGLSTGATP